jgi:hypothetical protein
MAAIDEIMICPASGPAAAANVQRTIANSVPWRNLAPTLNPDTADVLAPLADASGSLHFWGFRENSRDKRDVAPRPPQSWQRLVPGTMLVFIGRGRTTYAATIASIVFDPQLSQELWDSPEFCWVVALTDVHALPDVTDDAIRD